MVYYTAKQLPNGRWGIYNELELLATISCSQTCKEIIKSMNSRVSQKQLRSAALNEKMKENFRGAVLL